MQSRRKITNKSSKGSTMLNVLVAVAFVALIGSVLMFTAMSNYALKQLNLQGKNTFYTAESVVEEVYTGMGMNTMDNISDAYTYALSNRKIVVNVGSNLIETEATNRESNTLMRRKFIKFLMDDIVGKDANGVAIFEDKADAQSIIYDYSRKGELDDVGAPACDNALNYLNSLIKNPTNAKVTSVGSVEVSTGEEDDGTDPNYKIVIRDANIYYKEDKVEDTFSEITIDFVIEYPDLSVVFDVERTNLIDAFKDYIFIGSNGVHFNGLASVNVTSGIYTDDKIEFNNTNATLSGSNFISAQDFIINSSGMESSNINVLNSQIWATNILLETTNKKNPGEGKYHNTLTIGSNTSTHVSDDLQLNGNYSKVNISGSFWGYGTNAGTHGGDSSIIVNGKGSYLDINNVKNLLLAGKAYINYKDTILSPTGESVALKGNQRYYVIPDEYITVDYTDSTGTYSGQSIEQPFNKNGVTAYKFNVDETALKDFFAVSLLKTDAAGNHEIRVVEAGDYVYAYMVFDGNQKRNNYVKCLLEGQTFTTNFFKNDGITLNAKQIESYAAMVENTKLYMRLLDSRAVVSVGSSTNIYTTGLLLQYAGGNFANGSSAGDNQDKDDMVDDTLVVNNTTTPLYVSSMINNFKNRASILSHVLLSMPEYTVNGGNNEYNVIDTTEVYSYVQDGKTYTILEGSYDKTVFGNLIDTVAVESSPLIAKSDYATTGEFACAINGNVIVPNEAKYGVVIATGNVVVNSSFHGLIICNGTITVTGGSSYSTNISSASGGRYDDLVHFIETYDDGALMRYIIPCQGAFAFGEPDEDSNQISKIKYTDLVAYTNWRKTIGE